ncbi:MAG TPA: nucleotide exchange factor GrpE [Candidatus Xenobia bacterium]
MNQPEDKPVLEPPSKPVSEADEKATPAESEQTSAEDEIRGLKEQIRRTQADFENYRRRQQNAQDEMRLLAKERILEAMLPLQDNLQRAVDAAKTTRNVDSLLEGLNLVLRQMRETFTKEGLVAITAQGALFDPNLHHAVTSEDRDDVPDQTVLEEFQKGYKLGERVLRPSLVKVARNESVIV